MGSEMCIRDRLYQGSKSDLIDELIATTPLSVSADVPTCDAVVIDGPAVVHMLSPKNGSTVDEYCALYLGYVTKFFDHAERIDLIFDVYIQASLKAGVRKKRGVAPPMVVRGITNEYNWGRFLKNASNTHSMILKLNTLHSTPIVNILRHRRQGLLWSSSSFCRVRCSLWVRWCCSATLSTNSVTVTKRHTTIFMASKI